MRRPCSEEENRIIRTIVSEILPAQSLSSGNISVLVPAILGFILGLAIGTLAALAMNTANRGTIAFVLIFCTFCMENICIFIWRNVQRKKTGNITKKQMAASGVFQINGGTVLNYYGNDREGSWLYYAEDDFLDSFGRPYIIQYPVYGMGDVRPGERILLICSEAGDYIPIRVNALTQEMIPMQNPSYFSHVDWSICTRLPHPNAAMMDRTAIRITQSETIAFAKKCNRWKGMKAKQTVGIILMSLLLLFLFAITFIMLVGREVVETPEAILAAGTGLIILWGLLSYGLARLISGVYREHSKLCFRKRVLFHSLTTTFVGYNIPIKEINVYEYDSVGIIRMMSYPVSTNVFLPKDLKYGTLIYKYSSKDDIETMGANYFGTIEEKHIY